MKQSHACTTAYTKLEPAYNHTAGKATEALIPRDKHLAFIGSAERESVVGTRFSGTFDNDV